MGNGLLGNGAKAEMLVLQGFFGSFNAVNAFPITYYLLPKTGKFLDSRKQTLFNPQVGSKSVL